jgi:hypothetical protein
VCAVRRCLDRAADSSRNDAGHGAVSEGALEPGGEPIVTAGCEHMPAPCPIRPPTPFVWHRRARSDNLTLFIIWQRTSGLPLRLLMRSVLIEKLFLLKNFFLNEKRSVFIEYRVVTNDPGPAQIRSRSCARSTATRRPLTLRVRPGPHGAAGTGRGAC